ncbi:MAG: arylesterase [Bacteroidota bacterium]|nr:MAG: G-D-S-L family lipolytic protein [Bacteroidetes bacterium OLB12]GIL21734.1 MAG: arylesterase [Bacteroidota bacterium]HNR73175.1 arylesterase [Cyclobacteriaceae bacterium]HNU40841.1 arylesterase [Cyclobacteriaceae bacterium]
MVVGKYSLLIVLLTAFFPAAQPKTILFFGDSLTAGYGLSPEEAFPALLEKELNKTEKKVRVVNAGLSGETSAGGLSRIDWILRQPVDVFVLELGANDGLRGLPLDQTQKNLQSIIDKVKAKYPACKIVLAGMMVPPNMGKQYTDSFRNMYPDLAKKNNATLIHFLLDGVAGNEKLNQADGIHPTAEGHKIIANNLKSVFEKLI